MYLQALTSDDADEAKRLAHSLKGIAATLAIEGVQSAALALEKVDSEQTDLRDQYLHEVITQLQLVFSGIDQWHA